MGEKNDTHKWPYLTELYRNFFKKKLPVKTNRYNYAHHKTIIFQNSKANLRFIHLDISLILQFQEFLNTQT